MNLDFVLLFLRQLDTFTIIGKTVAAEEKYPSDCTGWAEHGFECVSKVACGSDGHFDTDTGQTVKDGIRSSDVYLLKKVFINARQ